MCNKQFQKCYNNKSVCTSKNIIKHNAPSPWHIFVNPSTAKRLEDVDYSERDKTNQS